MTPSGAGHCWGYGARGQLGDGSGTTSSVPVTVATDGVLAGKRLTSIDAGRNFACALDSAGRAYCWGANDFGLVLGNGSELTEEASKPVAVTDDGVLSDAALTQISAGYSSVVALVGAALTVPGAPTGVAGVAGNRQVTVSWTAPVSDGDSPITGYTVTASPGGATCVTAGALSCVVAGLTNGIAYTFTVTATNAIGTGPASSPSAPVTPAEVPLAPGAPTGVSGVAGNGQVTVSWTAPVADGGSPITGYAVVASPGGATCATTGALSCVVTGLTNGTAYTFTVTASNAVGTGPASTPSAPVTPAAVPGAPTSVAGVPGNGQVTVSWTAPATTGGLPVTYAVAIASPTSQVKCVTAALSCVVTGLTNGTAYTFIVTASNSVGPGPASQPSAAVTPTAPPVAPSLTLSLQARRFGNPITTTGLGDNFQYAATVVNNGSGAATGTVLTIPLSSAHRVPAALPADCRASSRSGPVSCTLGTIGAGVSRTVTVTVEAAFDCDIVGDSSANTLTGTAAPEVICGGGGGDTITGGGGNDRVFGYGNRVGGIRTTGDRVSTGARVTYGPGTQPSASAAPITVLIAGNDGADTITTGGGVDAINAEEGGDRINAGNGGTATSEQSVNGGTGADTLTGGSGVDRLIGGDGDDLVNGSGGDDVVFGNDGDDEASGGAGNDHVRGGLDNDTLRGDAGNDQLEGSEGVDLLYGSTGDDDLDGDAGSDYLSGGDGADILLGFAGVDRLYGNDGHDYLDGNDGNDTLDGGYGRDVLRGNAGEDTLDGGPSVGSAAATPGDHWNRLYGDAGTRNVCRPGPGAGVNNTNYRAPTCQLTAPNTPGGTTGWRNGSRPRLDRGAADQAQFPG